MAKLSDEIKRALSSLAFQDAGEFLSTREKIEMIRQGTERDQKTEIAKRPSTSSESSSKRIALLSDGSRANSAVNYAIESASRLGAKIDLLTHAAAEADSLVELEKQIRAADILYHRIPLKRKGYKEILAYLQATPALIFLVASVGDSIASTLAEEVIPNQLSVVPVPLVLIKENQTPRNHGHNAA